MHRAAEVLGCRSSSTGDGSQRRVVLSWTKDGTFPIGERAVLAAVHSVLKGLFPSRDDDGDLMSRTQKKSLRQSERAIRRREKKLEDEAKIADLAVDPEVVQALVAEMNWHALDRLYQGVRVPAIERKKRQARKKAKAMEKEARQMEAMQSGGMYGAGGYGGMGRNVEGIEWNRMGSPAMNARTGMMLGDYAGGFLEFPRAGFGEMHEGMACIEMHEGMAGVRGEVGQGCGRGMSRRLGLEGVGGSDGGNVGRGSSKKGQSSGARAALNGRPLEKNNRGFEMLEKMGWKKGDGLGSEREGRREPVVAELRRHRAGLGG